MSDKRQKGKKPHSNKKKKEIVKYDGRRTKHEKLDIKFDAGARREYLTSGSSKKKEKRAYGLASEYYGMTFFLSKSLFTMDRGGNFSLSSNIITIIFYVGL